MRPTRKVLVIGIGALVSFCTVGEPAFATEQHLSNSVTIAQNQIVQDDLLAAGSDVQVLGRVNGDVTVAGANVEVSGPVKGDVLATGATINISSPVGDDVRAAGGTVTVKGTVKDNVLLAGGTVVLAPGAYVGRDAHLGGGTVDIQGHIQRNLVLAATDGRLAGEVGGSVEAHTQTLTLLPGAVVRGDLKVYGPNPPVVSSGARVFGHIDYQRAEAETQTASTNWTGWLTGWLFQFLALMALGIVVVPFSKVWVDRVSDTLTRQIGLSVLLGAVALIFVPIFSVMLLFTLIGIPLAIVLLAVFTVALLLSGVFVAYRLGSWLLGKAVPLLQFTLGALIVAFLAALPWIGGLVVLAVLTVGIGALVVERYQFTQQLRSQGLT